jgi:uncharacterized membrane protein
MIRRILIAIIVLSITGLVVAGYSFLHNQSVASGEFCSISETFDCDLVNKGPYGKFFGIPVSLIGIGGYLLLAATAGFLLKNLHDRGVRLFLLLAATGGFLFSLYLTSVEAFVLHAWCLLCLTSQALMLMVFGLSVWIWRHDHLTT